MLTWLAYIVIIFGGAVVAGIIAIVIALITGQHRRPPLDDEQYIERALSRARYELLEEDNEVYAEIPGLQGLYGTGETQEAAAVDLRGALMAWIRIRRRQGLSLPPLD